MGESKRRKEILKENYGIPDINAQVAIAWANIESAINNAKTEKPEYLLIQCCNQHRGFHYDAIAQIEKQMSKWGCGLPIPILIQILPEGFKTSETKLFDGFITLWTNDPGCEVWAEFLQTKI